MGSCQARAGDKAGSKSPSSSPILAIITSNRVFTGLIIVDEDLGAIDGKVHRFERITSTLASRTSRP
ncbi:hypothetical protein Ancab_004590, partial [Ancistrocladus abbreviatus]